MKKQLLLAVVLLGAFGIANADAPKSKGFYVGGSAHVVGMIPFGTSGWELFGQLGLAQVGLDINIQGVDDLEDNATTAGIGVRWHVTQNIAIGAQVDAYVWTNDTIGSNFDLSVATQQLNFQITF